MIVAEYELGNLVDAMVESLEGAYSAGRISKDISVKRVYEVDINFETLVDETAGGLIHVYLSPEDEPDTDYPQNRNHIQVDYRIQVAVVAKVATTANEFVDPILALIQELRDYFFKHSVESSPFTRSAIARKIETATYFDRQRLIDARLIVSTFFLSFTGMRPRC